MAAPGHTPLTNGDRPDRPTAGLESALAPLTSRPTLPYYRRPSRRSSPVRIETSVEEAAGAASEPDDVLLDAAAASFGVAAVNTTSAVLEAIVGEDDRVRVSRERMAMNPWRQICALRILSQTDRTFVGTAWFIAPKVLATAGHCVFMQDEGGWAKSIRVIPAKRGSDEPFGTLVSTRFAAVDGWVKQRGRDFDYGVIFLDDGRTGTKVGNFAVQALANGVLKGTDAQISGYPADRDRATFQYFHMRPMMDVTDTQLVYDIDTFGGQSGSPIWQNTDEMGIVAVGIHTTGGASSNSGTRINEDVLGNLVRWVEAA